jgi:small subunit ribosomal protein S6
MRIHRPEAGIRGRGKGEPVLDYPPFPFRSVPIGAPDVSGAYPLEGVAARMRRYELMLVVRPDVPDDKSQAVIDRVTRLITTSGGQIIKVAPWGRRRLAYPIDRFREGSYHIILFSSPPDGLTELEHSLLITEEVLRHLVTRDDRPAKSGRREDGDAEDVEDGEDVDLPLGIDEDEDADDGPERIGEDESEAAPAAID